MMSKQVPWNKIILERFIELSCLTKLEEEVIRTRTAGWSRTKQAAELNVSISTIDKTISTLKRKYDSVQKYDPILPPRKLSSEEIWMDNN